MISYKIDESELFCRKYYKKSVGLTFTEEAIFESVMQLHNSKSPRVKILQFHKSIGIIRWIML